MPLLKKGNPRIAQWKKGSKGGRLRRREGNYSGCAVRCSVCDRNSPIAGKSCPTPTPTRPALPALHEYGFVVTDEPAQLYEAGDKTAEIDYNNGPLKAARGQRVGVIVGASSGRHGEGRYVIADGDLVYEESYIVTRAQWREWRNMHRGGACGYGYRRGARVWRMLNVLPRSKPVRIKVHRGYRRWTPINKY